MWDTSWIWKKDKPMMEFESYSYKPDDIKSRYMILMDLLDLWEDGIMLLNRQMDYSPNKQTAMKIMELEIAVKMLKTQIEVMCGYKRFSDRYGVITGFDEKPENIKGGRGTELKDRTPWKDKKDNDEGDLLNA